MHAIFVDQMQGRAGRQTGGRKIRQRPGRLTATLATTSTATTPPPCSTRATVFTIHTLECSALIRQTRPRRLPTRICCRSLTARRTVSRSTTTHRIPTASTLPSHHRCPFTRRDRGLPPEPPDRRTRSTATGTSGPRRWLADTGRDPRHRPRDLIMVNFVL
jgi:hypothetical protein